MPELPISTEKTTIKDERRRKTEKFVEGKKYAVALNELVNFVPNMLFLSLLLL